MPEQLHPELQKLLHNPHQPIPEITIIRRLIRQTDHAIRHSLIDFIEGTRLIARLTQSLSTLLHTQHTLSPKQNPDHQLINLLDHLLHNYSPNPDPDLDPNPVSPNKKRREPKLPPP